MKKLFLSLCIAAIFTFSIIGGLGPPLYAGTAPYTAPEIKNLPEGIKNPFDTRYGSPYTENGALKNKRMGWGFGRNKHFQPPTAQTEFDIRQFNGYYLGDITRKEVYLTFDEGYEYGYTPQILDTLLEKGVKAAFFVTKPYIKANPELCKRMADEGHIVANHTVSHKNSVEQSDEAFRRELEETANYYKEVTGHDMDMYFRFPAGVYSARTISLANDMGYKTIFWSLAFVDWEVNNQPGKQAAFNAVTQYIHNGCIILLHAVSESNTQALADIIDHIKAEGYVFKSLEELPVY
ncbi:MAG: polysaccharide deacetylase family protein [Defluviitaleaceae bacterium]|nr:polysaccharide deacetylase family protein [Defluviitaleaceae bacterium]MCL2837126.1 polysaccharide deacetylase family protein [Defluviitaleaceae bacterium]